MFHLLNSTLDFVIAGESTNLNIVNKAKGILWLKIFTQGKTAHSAYPWKGKNAIWKMQKFLTLLEEEYPVPDQEDWITTINLSRINTNNHTFNKIPDDCEIWLDIRYIPKNSDIIVRNIKKLLPKGFKMKIIEKEPALSVNENNQFIQILRKTTQRITKKQAILYGAQGSSDVRHYAKINCPGIEFGPVGGGIGSDKEWIEIPSLINYVKILQDFLLTVKD